MARKSIGLSSLKLGAVGVSGAMGTSLTALGATVSDTAAITTEEGTTTDFNIEESDSPFYSYESTPGKQVLAWSSYDVDLDTIYRFYGGSAPVAPAGAVNAFGAITGGSTYTNGSYTNVSLTGGTGSGATANITVAGAVVTVVTKVNSGQGYTASDSLSALAADIGGTGTGFAVVVTSIFSGPASWEMPDTLPALEQSIEIITKDLWKIEIVRASVVARMQWNLQKTKLAQLDFTATILQPTLGGTKKMKFTEPA